jgi:S-adenosylmethionine synthetase
MVIGTDLSPIQPNFVPPNLKFELDDAQLEWTYGENSFYFASESVTEGHPDKLCDSLSDSILDACLTQDPNSKVACESVAKSNTILIAGEITTLAKIDIDQIVRNRIKEVGYDDEKKGMNYQTCEIIIKVTRQSPDISQCVHENKKDEDIGAGDQGHMFGYATDETKELFPYSHLLALRLSEKLTEVRKNKTLPWLRPDGKTQVTVEYVKEKNEIRPLRIHNILISTQHDPEVTLEDIKRLVKEHVILPTVNMDLIDENTQFFINPSGIFIIGGPEADAGLTGRKIIVDTYGGWGAHGGGAFSGKDPSKVDRSAAYAARWVAKSLVAAGLCKRALVQISYSIGIADPLSVHIDSFGTVTNGKSDMDLFNVVVNNFNLKPGVIISDLNLKRPIYTKTSTGGHFGRDEKDFTWEQPRKLNF